MDVREDLLGRYPLVAILALALTLRVAWVLWIPVDPVSDPYAYLAMARTLATEGVYGFEAGAPVATWPVGTSAVYAGLSLVFGPSANAVAAFNLCVSMANVFLTFVLGRRIAGRQTGIVAAGAFAVWPQMIFFVTIPASEPMFLTILLLAVMAWQHTMESGRLSLIILTGLLMAAACYLRSVALLLPAALAMGSLVMRAAPFARVAATTLGACLVMALAIAPWTLRNTEVFGRVILISSNLGTNLHIGNHGGATGRFERAPPAEDALIKQDYAAASRALGAEAARYIADNPGDFLVGMARKFWMTHDRETIGVAWNAGGFEGRIGDRGKHALKLVATGYWYAVLALAVLGGAWVAATRVAPLNAFVLPVLPWAYFAGVHAVILGGDRFHMPSTPFIAILAGLAFSRIRALRHAANAPPTGTCLPLSESDHA